MILRICAVVALAATFTHQAVAEIRIGVVGPMTGVFAPYGAQMAGGAAQAATAINSRGGINGEQVELVALDDLSDPARAEAIARNLVEQDVAAVIGHFTTGASNAAAPIYADAGILMISPASTDPTLTDRGLWNVFRIPPRDDLQAELAGRHIVRQYAGGRIALVHDKSAYGKGLADGVRQVINASGLNDVLYAGIDVGESSYAAFVASLAEADIDVVYFGGLHAEAAIILREMRQRGIEAEFIAGDGILSPEFPVRAGGAAEGALMTAALEHGDEEARSGLMRGLEESGLSGGRYALNTFIALRVLEEAAALAGTNDMTEIARLLRAGETLQLEIGPVSFDAKGDAAFAEFGLFRWQAGESGFVDYRDNLVAR